MFVLPYALLSMSFAVLAGRDMRRRGAPIVAGFSTAFLCLTVLPLGLLMWRIAANRHTRILRTTGLSPTR